MSNVKVFFWSLNYVAVLIQGGVGVPTSKRAQHAGVDDRRSREEVALQGQLVAAVQGCVLEKFHLSPQRTDDYASQDHSDPCKDSYTFLPTERSVQSRPETTSNNNTQ